MKKLRLRQIKRFAETMEMMNGWAMKQGLVISAIWPIKLQSYITPPENAEFKCEDDDNEDND